MFIHPFAFYSVLPPTNCRIMQNYLQVPNPVFTLQMFQTPPTTQFITDNRYTYQSKAISKKINRTDKNLPRNKEKKASNSYPIISKKVKSTEEIKLYDPPTPLVCHVCGDKAGKHSYYGGQACTSCRAFFRRAVQSEYHLAYFCVKERNCDLYLRARKACQYCRYQACLAAGMKTTWVFNEEEKRNFLENRKKKKEEKIKCLEKRKNEKSTHVFKEPLPPLLPMQPLNYISDEEVAKVEKYIQISGYFDGSKINDLGERLVRELIR